MILQAFDYIFKGIIMNVKIKKVKFNYTVQEKHWVGDGFHVHGLLRPSDELNKFTFNLRGSLLPNTDDAVLSSPTCF